MLPANLPDMLRAVGLTVVEVDGWEHRGRPASTGGFDPTGVLNHHTGASAKGWSLARELAYAKWMFLTGRPDLPPPLCHMSIGRSGTVYIGAAGRANHAGAARASGTVAGGDGNRLYIGIEWMLSGTEVIPDDMRKVGVLVNAVLTEKVTHTSVNTISAHYQTSITGKWDIGDPTSKVMHGNKRVLDMDRFRNDVAAERKRLWHSASAPNPDKGEPDVTTRCNATIVVANNNLMALPKNKHVRETLLCSPRASVLLVQEGNLIAFKKEMASLPGYKVAGSLHTGPGSANFSNFVLYKPNVWDLVSVEFVKQYDGVTHVSNTRYLCAAVLRHKTLDEEFCFISYHAVTKGNDKKRKAMREQGNAASRKTIRKYRAKGIPVIEGGDYNSTINLHPSADVRTTHGIDQQYAWGCARIKVGKVAAHINRTPSDHDALVVDYTATVK